MLPTQGTQKKNGCMNEKSPALLFADSKTSKICLEGSTRGKFMLAQSNGLILW